MSEMKAKFGFKIGDIVRLSEEYFNFTTFRKGRERRFEVIGFGKEGTWNEESIRLKRLDLASGRRESYHYSFLEK